jgi:hypothetical protein
MPQGSQLQKPTPPPTERLAPEDSPLVSAQHINTTTQTPLPLGPLFKIIFLSFLLIKTV